MRKAHATGDYRVATRRVSTRFAVRWSPGTRSFSQRCWTRLDLIRSWTNFSSRATRRRGVAKRGFRDTIRELEIIMSCEEILKNRVKPCRCTQLLVPTWKSMSCCEYSKNLLKISKFPNHYILKLFQKLWENFFQNFFSKLTVTSDYFPDIYVTFLITQLFLKIFLKYRKNFLKIASFKSFLTVPLNFLRISKYMAIFSEFRNTYKFPRNFRIPFSLSYSQC